MTSSTYLPVDPRPASLAADLLFREGPEEDRAELRNAVKELIREMWREWDRLEKDGAL